MAVCAGANGTTKVLGNLAVEGQVRSKEPSEREVGLASALVETKRRALDDMTMAMHRMTLSMAAPGKLPASSDVALIPMGAASSCGTMDLSISSTMIYTGLRTSPGCSGPSLNLTFNITDVPVRGIFLQTFANTSFPFNGPGLHPSNGNFVVNLFAVEVDDQGVAFDIPKATASYEQLLSDNKWHNIRYVL